MSNLIEKVRSELLLQELKLINSTHNFIENSLDLNELQKFAAFKDQTVSYDCDASILPTVLYKKLIYPEMEIEEYAKSKYKLVGEEFCLRGDVMTSATVTLKTYVRLFHSDLLNKGNVPEHLWIGRNNQAHWAHFVANNIPYSPGDQ